MSMSLKQAVRYGPYPPRFGQPLSEREKEVVRLAARGLNNKAIGLELFLGENTIKTHLRRASIKVGARNRAHIVALLMLQGVITPEDVIPGGHR